MSHENPHRMIRLPGRGPAGQPRRLRVTSSATVAAMVAAVLIAPGNPSAAAPKPQPPGGDAALAFGEHMITLITGDRVRVTGPLNAPQVVESQAVIGPDRPNPRLTTRSRPEGTYVLPDDAMPAIAAGTLDQELFNVTYLAANGYTDAATKQVPVIVQYSGRQGAVAVRSAADALPASVPTHMLESINAGALEVPKAEAGAFWSAVRGKASASPSGKAAPQPLAGGIAKIWLDRKATVALDQSVPLIGAPQAWQAGHDGTGVKVAVLDTGIDADHPDVAGKIVESRSFIPGQEVDGHGHGTHVASTIAGSGAAAGGSRKGVAPGAQLVIGKVLADSGSGGTSQIIEGMEWAAARAKVVNMSLGSGATDGSDPLSQAVNQLTASTGALFVISAGNSGSAAETVGAPGAADAALTVAATDKSDQLAGFSSRGPRRVDGALKPDIAAPGVHITAARASRTSLCQGACVQPGDGPVDENYTAASGTSMAAPHVAGAAAIVAQRHPDWSPAQLKAALMSTAVDAGHTVYEQGAGRVDVARADRQQVVATTANVDYGTVPASEQEVPSKEIGYRNDGDTPVTLTLRTSFEAVGGEAVTGRLSTPDTVIIPAHGTAAVTVTLNVAGLGESRYTGTVVATDGADIKVTTPVGLVRGPNTSRLTVRSLDRNGEPGYIERQLAAAHVFRLSGDNPQQIHHASQGLGTRIYLVPDGVYSVASMVEWVEDGRQNYAWLFDPEVTVDGNTEITLDARNAVPVRFDTQRPSAPRDAKSTVDAHGNNGETAYERTTPSGRIMYDAFHSTGSDQLWVTPTKPVTMGKLKFSLHRTLGAPEIEMTMRSPVKQQLHPVIRSHTRELGEHYQDRFRGFVPFTGSSNLPLTDAGLGRAEDLSGKDLTGKLTLLQAEHTIDLNTGLPICWIRTDKLIALREAGAAGVITYAEQPQCATPITYFRGTRDEPTGVPVASLPTSEATNLRGRLIAGESVTIEVVGTPKTPYIYSLHPFENGRIPDSLHYTVRDRETAELDLTINESTRPTDDYLINHQVGERDGSGVVGTASITDEHTGLQTTEYIWPLSSKLLHTRSVRRYNGPATGQVTWPTRLEFDTHVFDRPGKYRQSWFGQPFTPGSATPDRAAAKLISSAGPPLTETYWGHVCTLCREGDLLLANFPMVTGGRENQHETGTDGGAEMEDFFDFDITLSKEDGTQLPRQWLIGTFFEMPPGPGRYRLSARGPQTEVTWDFASTTPTTNSEPATHSCFLRDRVGRALHCQPEPLVFASYDLGSSLAADNTVAAGRGHTFRVRAYHADSTRPMPEIAGVRLWASTDDGAAWQPVDLTYDKDGEYVARTNYPALGSTTGAVSLKVEAWDAAGNRIEQTTKRAFNLRAH